MSGRKMAIITQPYDRSVTLPEAVCALPATGGGRGGRERGGEKGRMLLAPADKNSCNESVCETDIPCLYDPVPGLRGCGGHPAA